MGRKKDKKKRKKGGGGKRPGSGQPTKYDPKYCKQLIAEMQKGITFSGFCGKIKVSKTTAYDWVDKHKEFKAAKGVALNCHAYWCDKEMIKGMWGGKSFNPTVWIFLMKNMHGWRDKMEISEYPEEEFSFDNG